MLRPDRPLRVALLTSRRAPGLAHLLADTSGGSVYKVVCAVASEENFADAALLEAAGIPLILHPIRPFYARAGRPLKDLDLRCEYDRRTATLLAAFEPDLILLSSYLFLLTAPLLSLYPGRIVNVHGSDLARTGPDGRPLYTGLRAVRDAIRAGEKETRATAHLVTERLDEGPILLRSQPFPVAPFVEMLRRRRAWHSVNAYAYAHQEWMLESAWGPLLDSAVRMLAGREEFLEEELERELLAVSS
jgi:phosphoribosylglycinamide formyltransferase-1